MAPIRAHRADARHRLSSSSGRSCSPKTSTERRPMLTRCSSLSPRGRRGARGPAGRPRAGHQRMARRQASLMRPSRSRHSARGRSSARTRPLIDVFKVRHGGFGVLSRPRVSISSRRSVIGSPSASASRLRVALVQSYVASDAPGTRRRERHAEIHRGRPGRMNTVSLSNRQNLPGRDTDAMHGLPPEQARPGRPRPSRPLAPGAR